MESAKEIREKIIREEIDINSQENFLSILIKGLIADLNGSIKVRGNSVPHFVLNTGDDIMYLENKGQNQSIEPREVSNEDFIYNRIPRCLVTPGGINIITDQVTSPYTRGQFELENEGNLYSFTAEFRRMPMTLSVELKYVFDTFIDTLEAMQYVITHVQMVRMFYIQYMGQMIPCSYKFPESMEEEYNAEFDGLTFDSKTKNLRVSLEVETNIPVFYPRTAIEGDKTISGRFDWIVSYKYFDDSDRTWKESSKTFESEEKAKEFAKDIEESGKTIETIKKTKKQFWNQHPVFKDGDYVGYQDLREERLSGKVDASKDHRP